MFDADIPEDPDTPDTPSDPSESPPLLEESTLPDPNEPEHSPGFIFYKVLLSEGLVAEHDKTPLEETDWPCFNETMPEGSLEPERLVCCTSTSPVSKGVSMTSGRPVQGYGVQIRIRGPIDQKVYHKCIGLLQAIALIGHKEYVVEEKTYIFHRASLSGGPIRVGKTETGRFDYTLNYTVAITEK